tara:strand:+ start:358 stop:663 length:306 start_codon:yes stop_codon:yes gene_type:complete
MKRGQLEGVVFLGVMAFIIIGAIFAVFYFIETDKQASRITKLSACEELGCPLHTSYVGSMRSDKYYTCECHHVAQVKPENLVCFTTDADAKTQGYAKVPDC